MHRRRLVEPAWALQGPVNLKNGVPCWVPRLVFTFLRFALRSMHHALVVRHEVVMR
jgi:hypothetical protein